MCRRGLGAGSGGNLLRGRRHDEGETTPLNPLSGPYLALSSPN